jgi:hypothetical protein
MEFINCSQKLYHNIPQGRVQIQRAKTLARSNLLHIRCSFDLGIIFSYSITVGNIIYLSFMCLNHCMSYAHILAI